MNFPFLDGNVALVCISYLIRFARVSSQDDDFNTRNQVLTKKLLRQGYRYNKIRKAFSKFNLQHFDIVSKYNAGFKTLLMQGVSEPEFYGRPKAALLFWFFSGFSCGVPLFIVMLVIY